MKILEKEFEFDILDADNVEKIENLQETMTKRINEIDTKNQKSSQVIRETCHIVMDCFNELFGDGTDKILFGDKTNLGVCLKAFQELVAEKEKQSLEYNETLSKYSIDRINK